MPPSPSAATRATLPLFCEIPRRRERRMCDGSAGAARQARHGRMAHIKRPQRRRKWGATAQPRLATTNTRPARA
eukprot:8313594-Alexandrium_andersonii.AAC.1